MTSQELVGLLGHKNDWYSREARRILAERRDATISGRAAGTGAEPQGPSGTGALWALYVTEGLDERGAATLGHANEDVRTWTVRLLGDAKKVSRPIRDRLVRWEDRPQSGVRNQLACSCKRLPGADALPIVRALLRRDEDVKDPQIPLLLGGRSRPRRCRTARSAGVTQDAGGRRPLVQQFLLERIGRRYLAENSDAGLRACAWLLDHAPGAAEVDLLVRAWTWR